VSKIVFRTLYIFSLYDVDVLIVIAVVNNLYNVVLCHFNYFWLFFQYRSPLFMFYFFLYGSFFSKAIVVLCLLLLHAST